MSTVNEMILRQPVAFQKRFSQETKWVDWINDLLEELAGEGIMPLVDFEVGVEVKSGQWITKPPGLRRIKKIYNPSSPDQRFNWEDVQGRIKLTTEPLDSEVYAYEVTTFGSYATDAVTVDVDALDENSLKNYLLVIDTGTLAGRAFVLSGNDASAGSATKVYFLHQLSAAMDGTSVLTGRIIGPEYYLMLSYSGMYTPVALGTDVVPIDSGYERRLTEAWLRWKCERSSSRSPDDAAPYFAAYQQVLSGIKAEIKSTTGGPVSGRQLVGFRR